MHEQLELTVTRRIGDGFKFYRQRCQTITPTARQRFVRQRKSTPTESHGV
jgi:hypothetical protein